MSGGPAERLRPGQIETRRRRALVHSVRREVHPYSALHQRRFSAAGLDPTAVRGPDDLIRLAPMGLDEVEDPASLVLRPTADAIARSGDLDLRARLLWAKLTDRAGWFNDHVVDPRFKPVHWTVDDGVMIGWSADDLNRLAELGRRWLAVAGVRRRDALVTVLPMAPTLAFWQLALGARAAGLSTVHVGRPPDRASLGRMAPTVVAGRLEDLLAIDGWPDLDRLRVVLAIGSPLDDRARAKLAKRVGGRANVLAAWAPPGVRALWVECGPGSGLHTWPETEVLHAGDEGIVWTPIGWRGSVLLRMKTAGAAAVDETPCRGCGRTTPRVHVAVGARR